MEDSCVMLVAEQGFLDDWPEEDIVEYDFGDDEVLRIYDRSN